MSKLLNRLSKLAILCGLLLPAAHADTQPEVLVIIDDLGNSLPLGRQAAQLPGPIHLAVLPHRKNSVELANLGHSLGQEILLHTPMTSLGDARPGVGELTDSMSREQFERTLISNLDSVPHIKGVNNHMGSQLTQQPEPMSWLMSVLYQRQLYFIDSRTTKATVAQQQAQQQGLPNLRRDVFLDNERDEQAIEERFEELLSKAKKQGMAVAIGHPYPETLAVLERKLPTLTLRGFKLKKASELIQSESRPAPCDPSLGYKALFEPPCQLRLRASAK